MFLTIPLHGSVKFSAMVMQAPIRKGGKGHKILAVFSVVTGSSSSKSICRLTATQTAQGPGESLAKICKATSHPLRKHAHNLPSGCEWSPANQEVT